MTRRFYGAVTLPPGSNLALEHRLDVLAFRSRADRDAWVRYPDTCPEDVQPVLYLSHNRERRIQVTRPEAARLLGLLMGGYDPHAPAMLSVWPTTQEEMKEGHHRSSLRVVAA